jgi:serine acetyltransferase
MLIGYKDSNGKRGVIAAVPKTGYRACIGLGAQFLGFAKVGDQRILGANADIVFDIYHDAHGVASLRQLHRRAVQVNLDSIVTMTSTQGNVT